MFQKSAFTPNPKKKGIGFVFAGTKTNNAKSVFSRRIRITDDFYIWKLMLTSYDSLLTIVPASCSWTVHEDKNYISI